MMIIISSTCYFKQQSSKSQPASPFELTKMLTPVNLSLISKVIIFASFANQFLHVDALRILFGTPCFSGHITPSGGVARALINAGHHVDAFVAGDCCDTLVPTRFANVSKCFPHEEINSNQSIISKNQIDGLLNVRDLFTQESLIKVFHAMNKFLSANKDNYDIIVHDYFVTGVDIAARVHKMPVVCSYIGYATLIYEDDKYSSNPESMTYAPESPMPQFVQKIVGAFAASIWHHFVSKQMFQVFQNLLQEHGVDLVLEERENDGAYPFSYYLRHAVVIHAGPPDMTLASPEAVHFDNNFNHIGFIPDELYWKPLSTKVEMFLAKSTKPVVYMSMGTVFEIGPEKLEALLEELSNQNSYSFIWSISLQYDSISQNGKYTTENGNLLLVSKIPQQTLLIHEKVEVFVTHAGANSMQEAIFAEKPMLVFPGFGDQPLNARRLVNNKVALPLAELTYPEIKKKLDMVLEETRYREMKSNLKKSKELMTSLGGYKKAVEVVEKVANGSLEVKETRQLANFVSDVHLFLSGVLLTLFLMTAAVIFGLYKLTKILFSAFKAKNKTD